MFKSCCFGPVCTSLRSLFAEKTPEDRLDSDETTKLHLDDFSDFSCSSASPLHRPLADESLELIVQDEPLPLYSAPFDLSFESVGSGDRPGPPSNCSLSYDENDEKADIFPKAETEPIATKADIFPKAETEPIATKADIFPKAETEPIATKADKFPKAETEPIATSINMENVDTEVQLTEGATVQECNSVQAHQPPAENADNRIEVVVDREVGRKDEEVVSVAATAEVVEQEATEAKVDEDLNTEADDVATPPVQTETAANVDVDATSDNVAVKVDDVTITDTTTTTTTGLAVDTTAEQVVEDVREENSGSDQRSSKESSPADVTPEVVAPSNKKQSRADKVRDKKTKRKEDRALEAVTKSLAALRTPDEKLDVLMKRYSELHEENKTLLLTSKQNERKATVAIREKDSLQLEHRKSLLAKNKMESLCRELQKYNREVKEESLTRAKLEEERRREIAANFQGSLTDIQEKMTANHETNNALRQENLDLQGKLRGLIEQYEKAQTTVDKVFDRNQEMTKEMERHQKEKELLMLELQQSYKKAELMQEQEKQLRLQLTTYTDKYNEFQTSLQNSNQVFQSFKGEMEKMTKKIKKLEKESIQWKRRAEEANKTMVAMAEEKSKSDKETSVLLLKNKRLEELCRALQSQRGTPSGGEDQNLDVDNKTSSSAPVVVAPVIVTDANENLSEESGPGKLDVPSEHCVDDVVNGTAEEPTEEEVAADDGETIGAETELVECESTEQLVAPVS